MGRSFDDKIPSTAAERSLTIGPLRENDKELGLKGAITLDMSRNRELWRFLALGAILAIAWSFPPKSLRQRRAGPVTFRPIFVTERMRFNKRLSLWRRNINMADQTSGDGKNDVVENKRRRISRWLRGLSFRTRRYRSSRQLHDNKSYSLESSKENKVVARSSDDETDSTSSFRSKIMHREYYDRDAWLAGWSTVETEECYELEPLVLEDGDNGPTYKPGAFPSDLVGTFFQNGPSKFEIGNDLVMHPFDADGMVRAVTFHGNDTNKKAWFRNRYVRTPGFVRENNRQAIMYRGIFGTAKNRGKWYSNIFDIRMKNVANTNVLFVPDYKNNTSGKLFALWEADQPIELDPVTLETKLHSRAAKVFGGRYSAHYKLDPRTNTLCNFNVRFNFPDISSTHKLSVMEHKTTDPVGNGESQTTLLYKDTYVLPGLALGHDMAITDNYFCFFRSPCVSFDPIPFLLGRRGAAQCFEWDNKRATHSNLHLVPRATVSAEPGYKAGVRTIKVPPSFSFHLCNAFETKDDKNRNVVTVDVIEADKMVMADSSGLKYAERPIWETIDLSKDLSPYKLVRYRVDPDTQTMISRDILNHGMATCDFPMIHPDFVGRPYRYAFVGCSASPGTMGPVQGLAKVDVEAGRVVEKWLPDHGEYLSEVVVVPRGEPGIGKSKVRAENEDNVYLIGYLIGKTSGNKAPSRLVVFDGISISKGPIVTCQLRQPLPHALHGCFVAGYAPEQTNEVLSSYFANERVAA